MALTPGQLSTLKADILADPVLAAQPMNADGHFAIAQAYKALAAPDYWVWRTNVSRADLYHGTSPDGTTWNWSTYKTQSVPEQNAWTQMFMNDVANFALPNLRAGVAAIFTGSAPQLAQQTHCLAVGRRRTNRAEKLFAVGNGQAATPSTMTFEGALSPTDVSQAREL